MGSDITMEDAVGENRSGRDKDQLGKKKNSFSGG